MMRSILSQVVLAVTCIACLGPFAAFSQDAGAVRPADARKPEDKAATKKPFVTSMSLYPVTMIDSPMKELAGVVGIMLEKEGFRSVDLAKAVFCPPPGQDFETTAAAFGKFVKKQKIEEDYAWYGEVQGSLKKGVKTIRAAIANRKGEIVWKVSVGPADDAFKSMKPKHPMACACILAMQVRPLLILASPEGRAKEGRLTRLARLEAGVPDEKEFEAMRSRAEVFKRSSGTVIMRIFAVRVFESTHKDGANHLATLINEQKLCRAQVVDKPLYLDIKRDRNELAVVWSMARAFQAYLKENPIDVDYALYADYLMNTETGRVGGVHFAICNKKGEWVVVDYENSHHADFQSVRPRSLQDCNRLVIRRLRHYLGQASKGGQEGQKGGS
jgi:hypothetical protein